MEKIPKIWLFVAVIALLAVFTLGLKYSNYQHNSSVLEEPLLLESIDEKTTTEELINEEIEAEFIEVYVTGEVNNPGVYKLPAGSRMYEALDLAEPLPSGQVRYLDLARLLHDEETILVPSIDEVEAGIVEASSAGSGLSASGGKVNINKASAAEMASQLNGIGPALSERIVDYRQNHGAFQSIEDIKKVSGIGDKKFDGIKDSITVK